MPDESRMNGIAEQLNDDSDDVNEASEATESEDSYESQDSGEAMADDASGFPYSETEKTTVYGTEETIEDYKQFLEQVQATAVAENGLSGIEARELHNAVLQLATEQDAGDAADLLEENRE